MKILFVSHKFYPEVGGIEVNSEILATGFFKAGHDVTIITWTKDANNKDFPFSVIRNPNILLLFKWHCWADVVFENNPSLRLTWPSIFFKTPLIVAIRTWISRGDGKIGLQDKLKLWWLRRAVSVIAVSEVIRLKCWPAAFVIGNPYRYYLFKILPEIERKNDFIFLGRLVSDKGADFTILALSKMINRCKSFNIECQKFSLTIVGEGPELENLRTLAIKEGVEDSVVFTGTLKGQKLVNCLNSHRYILIPSLWSEPFGNVALEGMACGCIPIVSDNSGLVDAVGNAGLTFKRGNLDDFVDCIWNLISNEELEKKIREAASIHLASHHPDIVSRRYLTIVEKAV